MFVNNDITYVPPGQPLIFEDVYRWRRYEFDVEKFGIRIRSTAFETISNRVRAALEVVRHSPKYQEDHPDGENLTKEMLHDLSLISGSIRGELPASIKHFFHSDGASWWLKISAGPAESFHADDYERVIKPVAGECTPYLTFGTVEIPQLDDLDIALSEDEENELPFAIDVASDDGLRRGVMPADEPLPLVREFCGVHGTSAFGRTVNVTTVGEISPMHQFCTPLGRIGEHLFATLYFHYVVEIEAPVMTRLAEQHVAPYVDLLIKSGFALEKGGNNWQILTRGGDVIHLYAGLDGKESEGVEVMPAMMLIVCAGGEFDPMQRSELLEAIQSIGRQEH